MKTCIQRIFQAVEQSVVDYQTDNLQPIFQTLKNGHMFEFEFNPQESTTQSIIENPAQFVSIDELLIPLSQFNEVLGKLGHELIFDGAKSSASIADFKLVSNQEAEQIKSLPQNIPLHLQTREECMG